MPINKKRTLALGVGLGWDIATVFNNMQFAVQDNSILATSIQDAYQKNTLSMQEPYVYAQDELIYSYHKNGFALHSLRSEKVSKFCYLESLFVPS